MDELSDEYQVFGSLIPETRFEILETLSDGYHFVLPLVPPDLAPISPKSKGALATRRSAAKSQPEIIVRLNRPIGGVSRNYGFHVSGTVEAWQHEIIKTLEGCSNVALACGTNLAAPLVAFADEQTGGFHIWDPESSIGKTAAQTTGESIYGIPSAITAIADTNERFGAKWATASDVGILGMAQMRTDVGLNLDELGAAKISREKLIEFIYTFTGGTTKLRGDSRGDLRPQLGFRTLLSSNGEFTQHSSLAMPSNYVAAVMQTAISGTSFARMQCGCDDMGADSALFTKARSRMAARLTGPARVPSSGSAS
jgi:hypothetical protein